ncbi:DNA polymerase lambda isoform X4 [Macaca nemestrina]|uniref:DNA polymerase n=1 Tax=Macaca mulatta TaxID=9544 RepID=A0A5F8A2E8_MACMU|nr:DNA polymerase lambda isoform X7 [Macaca fascicularis]XP_021799298.1 DNA polymerase lambda isoform X3 [Papio anubis]XP_028709310.1 DNA polymerase lambda isoform X6 [Macaca mulatta]XP_050660960.1 DNA polymerase lambda isoform X4 [Macaca thibetana thibetana]
MDPRGILKAFPKRKKIHADASSKVLAKIPRKEEGEEAEEWLSSLRAHVVRTGIGRARAELFEKQIVQHGGQLCPVQGPGVTHIVVDEGMDYERALRLLRLPRLPPGAQLVKSAWLSLCLQERRLVDVAGFSIFIPSRYLDQSQPSKAEQDASLPPGTHEALLQTALPPPPSPTRPVSPPQKTKEAPNTQAQPISDDEASDGEETQVSAADLEALISGHYPASLEGDCDPSPAPVVLDKWVCAQPSSQKATNHNLHITEKLEVLAKAYSVQGDKWRALGYAKAINALKSFHKPVTSYQVQKAAQAFNSGLLCVACGSYRRGKATCGDVDVLITHPDGRSHRGIFSRLLDSLRQQGFLTDDLVSQEENGQQQKYLGVCRLPGPGWRHRRLDIIVVPYSEFACALLYFTGSAHFNRSMRALAKTKGMSLSEHALSTAVVRNTHGCKMGPGRVLPTPTEKDVFRLLGLPYREPAERDW